MKSPAEGESRTGGGTFSVLISRRITFVLEDAGVRAVRRGLKRLVAVTTMHCCFLNGEDECSLQQSTRLPSRTRPLTLSTLSLFHSPTHLFVVEAAPGSAAGH